MHTAMLHATVASGKDNGQSELNPGRFFWLLGGKRTNDRTTMLLVTAHGSQRERESDGGKKCEQKQEKNERKVHWIHHDCAVGVRSRRCTHTHTVNLILFCCLSLDEIHPVSPRPSPRPAHLKQSCSQILDRINFPARSLSTRAQLYLHCLVLK